MERKRKFYAYTDGSCENSGKSWPGGSAYVILDEDKNPIYEKSKGFLNTSNNRMELLAIISAVNWISGNCRKGSMLEIFTDSMYCITVIGRERSHLMKNRKHPLKNMDLINLFYDLAADMEVRFHWIKGHDGDEWNEYVDDLAGTACRKIQSSVF